MQQQNLKITGGIYDKLHRVRKLLLLYLVYTLKILNTQKVALNLYCSQPTAIEQKTLGVCKTHS